MRLLLTLLALLSSCSQEVCSCPEPVVCDLAVKDERSLQYKLSRQADRLANLTIEASRIETAKDRCPEPDCHCAPVRRKHKKHPLPYPGIE